MENMRNGLVNRMRKTLAMKGYGWKTMIDQQNYLDVHFPEATFEETYAAIVGDSKKIQEQLRERSRVFESHDALREFLYEKYNIKP